MNEEEKRILNRRLLLLAALKNEERLNVVFKILDSVDGLSFEEIGEKSGIERKSLLAYHIAVMCESGIARIVKRDDGVVYVIEDIVIKLFKELNIIEE